MMMEMRTLFILILLFLSISFILASCEEGQIDINSAPKEDLMKITGLGGEGIIAQRVIDNRPFSSLDDLTKVSGIKESKLAAIKSQGLACVADEETEENGVNIETEVDIEIDINSTSGSNFSSSSIKETQLQTINLNPKAIKSDVDSQVSDSENKSDLAVYGLITFAVLLGFLFLVRNLIIKRRKGELV